MTDRELLELAAEAAEIEAGEWNKDVGLSTYTRWRGLPQQEWWNPLADDGDAFRLAVRLGIHLSNSDTDAWATHLKVTAIEGLGDDPYAATRRAIVRAAAAIGEQQ